MPDLQFTEEDIFRLLRASNPFCSMGPDEIHPRILKESAYELAGPFYTLFRQSLNSGSLPHSWKTAHITPIFKSGDRLSPTSYRPISLTSIPCKILERIIKTHMLNHLTRNNLIATEQHGFLPGKSCITNLLLFMDSLTQARDSGLITDSIFFDFAKAFDKVPHQPLIHKLQEYGITGDILKWIESFLTSRTFQVRVGFTASNASVIRSGVPQGSVLGPLLFMIYINDLPENIISQSLLYADDLKIWNTEPNQLQMDIDAINDWSERWGMPLNHSKCVHITFGRESTYTYGFNTPDGFAAIPTKDGIKDLGVTFTSNLKFSRHHAITTAKATQLLNLFRRTFPKITETDFHILYSTYIRPILEYGHSVTYANSAGDENQLERVQRAATKLVYGLRQVPYWNRMEILNLYPLDVRRLRGDLILLYTLFESGQVTQLFGSATTDHLRGHERKLFKPRAGSSIRLNFYSCRIVESWNNLPREVVCAPSKDSFKRRLDKYLGINN